MHLYARLHAWLGSLFRPSEATLTREVHERVLTLMHERGLARPGGRAALAARIADDVLERIGGDVGGDQRKLALTLAASVLDYEEMFVVPEIDWSERRSVSELWALRDSLKVQKALLEHFEAVVDLVSTTLARAVFALQSASPTAGGVDDDIAITSWTARTDLLADFGGVVESVMALCFDDETERYDLFPRLKRKLNFNLIAASGGNPLDPQAFRRAPTIPSKSDIADRRVLVEAYLGGTPLTKLFEGTLPFAITARTRFEHHHIIAGSGHGKTQTLQYLIAHDLTAVERGAASIVVLDSQGDLIKTISQLKVFAPGEPLHDRIVVIDPTDVEYPVSLNLFDVGIERLQQYPMLERERLTNSILELYDFVLGSLLAAEMTQKQNVIFRYVTRLMLHIPDATIHTLRELMEPGSEKVFAPHIAKLTGTARQFFETEFSSREFSDTKKQVLRRLWGILENQTFERMFSHPRSKLDLFAEMNAGKVILINTAKDLLKESGTEIFGRFFIAMIAQAAQERAVLPEGKRLPTFVYVDEAADYLDRNIGLILSQARKFNVGMVLAHQYLGQLDPKLQEAFGANTAIKFAGGVSNKDARALAPMLGSTPEFIESQPKGSFAVSVRGLRTTALPLRFPLGHMEAMPKMSRGERADLQKAMRQRYAVHFAELETDASSFPGAPAESSKAGVSKQQPTTPEQSKSSGLDHTDTSPTPRW